MMMMVALWAALQGSTNIYASLTTDPTTQAAEWLVGSMVAVLWLAFALEYTGREQYVSRNLIAGLAIVPSVTAAVILAGDPAGLVREGACVTSFHPGVGYVMVGCPLGLGAVGTLVYAYLLVLLGVGLLAETMFTDDRLYADQAGLLMIGIIVPLVTSVSWALGLVPLVGYDPTPVSFAISGLAFSGAIFRYQFMDLMPATRRIGESSALRDLKDGVIILDMDDRLLRINRAAEEQFDLNPASVVGDPVSTVLGSDAFEIEPGETVSTLDTAGGRRSFEVTISPITNRHDRRIGHTLVFRDVTRRKQRKQQLSALNRVLRHNLRNDMNVVRGYAKTLSERTTDPEAKMAESIAKQSTDLVRVGSKVRDMEKIMERPRSEYRRFDIAQLVRDVADGVRRDHPEARVILDLPPEIRIRSDDLVLGTVLENVVRNAVEHNDGHPIVEVTAISRGDWVTIAVTDDGPGIPDQERKALLEGRETDLRHGSGLGLWVVNWGVTKLGGDLSFQDPDDGGTRVEIRLPGATTPTEDDAVIPEVGAD